MINAHYHIAYFAPVNLLTVWAIGLLMAEVASPWQAGEPERTPRSQAGKRERTVGRG